MKHEILPHPIHCPYCGEPIEILIDASQERQKYIEDCQVCCRPISLDIQVDEEGDVTTQVKEEEEDY